MSKNNTNKIQADIEFTVDREILKGLIFAQYQESLPEYIKDGKIKIDELMDLVPKLMSEEDPAKFKDCEAKLDLILGSFASLDILDGANYREKLSIKLQDNPPKVTNYIFFRSLIKHNFILLHEKDLQLFAIKTIINNDKNSNYEDIESLVNYCKKQEISISQIFTTIPDYNESKSSILGFCVDSFTKKEFDRASLFKITQLLIENSKEGIDIINEGTLTPLAIAGLLYSNATRKENYDKELAQYSVKLIALLLIKNANIEKVTNVRPDVLDFMSNIKKNINHYKIKTLQEFEKKTAEILPLDYTNNNEILNYLDEKYNIDIARWMCHQIANFDKEKIDPTKEFTNSIKLIIEAIKNPKSVADLIKNEYIIENLKHPAPEMVLVELELLKIKKLLSNTKISEQIRIGLVDAKISDKDPYEYLKDQIGKIAGVKQLAKYQAPHAPVGGKKGGKAAKSIDYKSFIKNLPLNLAYLPLLSHPDLTNQQEAIELISLKSLMSSEKFHEGEYLEDLLKILEMIYVIIERDDPKSSEELNPKRDTIRAMIENTQENVNYTKLEISSALFFTEPNRDDAKDIKFLEKLYKFFDEIIKNSPQHLELAITHIYKNNFGNIHSSLTKEKGPKGKAPLFYCLVKETMKMAEEYQKNPNKELKNRLSYLYQTTETMVCDNYIQESDLQYCFVRAIEDREVAQMIGVLDALKNIKNKNITLSDQFIRAFAFVDIEPLISVRPILKRDLVYFIQHQPLDGKPIIRRSRKEHVDLLINALQSFDEYYKKFGINIFFEKTVINELTALHVIDPKITEFFTARGVVFEKSKLTEKEFGQACMAKRSEIASSHLLLEINQDIISESKAKKEQDEKLASEYFEYKKSGKKLSPKGLKLKKLIEDLDDVDAKNFKEIFAKIDLEDSGFGALFLLNNDNVNIKTDLANLIVNNLDCQDKTGKTFRQFFKNRLSGIIGLSTIFSSYLINECYITKKEYETSNDILLKLLVILRNGNPKSFKEIQEVFVTSARNDEFLELIADAISVGRSDFIVLKSPSIIVHIAQNINDFKSIFTKNLIDEKGDIICTGKELLDKFCKLLLPIARENLSTKNIDNALANVSFAHFKKSLKSKYDTDNILHHFHETISELFADKDLPENYQEIVRTIDEHRLEINKAPFSFVKKLSNIKIEGNQEKSDAPDIIEFLFENIENKFKEDKKAITDNKNELLRQICDQQPPLPAIYITSAIIESGLSSEEILDLGILQKELKELSYENSQRTIAIARHFFSNAKNIEDKRFVNLLVNIVEKYQDLSIENVLYGSEMQDDDRFFVDKESVIEDAKKSLKGFKAKQLEERFLADTDFVLEEDILPEKTSEDLVIAAIKAAVPEAIAISSAKSTSAKEAKIKRENLKAAREKEEAEKKAAIEEAKRKEIAQKIREEKEFQALIAELKGNYKEVDTAIKNLQGEIGREKEVAKNAIQKWRSVVENKKAQKAIEVEKERLSELTFKELAEEISTSPSALEDLISRHIDLEISVTELTQMTDSFLESEKKYTEELEKTQAEIDRLTKQIDRQKADLEKQRTEHQKTLEKKEVEKQQLKKDLSKSNKDLKTKNTELQQELDKLKEEKLKSDMAAKLLQTRLDKVTTELAAIKKPPIETRSFATQTEKTRSSARDFSTQTEKTRSSARDFSSQTVGKDNSEEITALKAQIDAMTADHQKRITIMQGDHQAAIQRALIQQKNGFDEFVARKNAEVAQRYAQYEQQLAIERTQYSQEIVGLRQQLDATNAALSQETEAKEKAQSDFKVRRALTLTPEELRDELAKARGEASNAKADAAAARRERDVVKEGLPELQAELDSLRAENLAYRQQQAAYYAAGAYPHDPRQQKPLLETPPPSTSPREARHSPGQFRGQGNGGRR